MSDENSKEQQVLDAERFKNYQKEVERKLGNTNSQIENLAKQNEELIRRLSAESSSSQQKSGIDESLSDLIYTDPDKYAELVKNKTKKEVMNELNTQNQVAQKQAQRVQGVLSKLQSDYPELKNDSSPLTQKAVEIYNGYSDEDRADQATAYRAAIMEAVADLGVKKVSQRSSGDGDEDYGDFVLSSKNKSRGKSGRKPKLDAETVEFAALMGLDVEDKEVLKRLAKRGQRDWSKYR